MSGLCQKAKTRYDTCTCEKILNYLKAEAMTICFFITICTSLKEKHKYSVSHFFKGDAHHI